MPHSSAIAQRKKQLLGTWQSDAKRTLDELAKRRIPVRRFEILRKLFGKLKLTFRPATVVSESPGRKREIGKYRILGADEHSIAIMHYLKLPSGIIKSSISHIHFKDDYYWIYLGDMREFFKRISPRKSASEKSVPSPIRRWKGKRKDTLKKLGYRTVDQYIKDVRGRERSIEMQK